MSGWDPDIIEKGSTIWTITCPEGHKHCWVVPPDEEIRESDITVKDCPICGHYGDARVTFTVAKSNMQRKTVAA